MIFLKSILIKDTTQKEREEIVQKSIGNVSGMCDGCSSGLVDMYDDYIYGKKEIAQINASFQRNFVKGDDDRQERTSSCVM